MSVGEQVEDVVRLTVDVPPSIDQRIEHIRERIAEANWTRRRCSKAAAVRDIIDEGLAVLESRYGVSEPDFADCDLEG